jgi:transposase
MNFIGCDVSKQKLDCALLCANSPDKPLHKKIPNSAAGVQELLTWVAKKTAFAPDSLHVVLEATGPYHEIAAKAFFDAGCRVSVVNPAYPKHYAQSLGLKSKTDRADAVILARYGQATSGLRRWQPPAPCYRQLQLLTSRHQALQADLQRERNRREKLLATQGDAFIAESLSRMLAHLQKEVDLVEQAIETCPSPRILICSAIGGCFNPSPE